MCRDPLESVSNYYVEVHSASQRAEREVAMSSHVHMHNKNRMEMKTKGLKFGHHIQSLLIIIVKLQSIG